MKAIKLIKGLEPHRVGYIINYSSVEQRHMITYYIDDSVFIYPVFGHIPCRPLVEGLEFTTAKDGAKWLIYNKFKK